MKRRVDSLSDTVIKDAREVTITGRVIGDYPLPPNDHVLMVAAPNDTVIEIGGKE